VGVVAPEVIHAGAGDGDEDVDDIELEGKLESDVKVEDDDVSLDYRESKVRVG